MTVRACVLLLMLTVLISSCPKHLAPIEPISAKLGGTSWQLTRIDTFIRAGIVLDQADTIILTFDDERRISGKSPGRCGNTYFGVYSISGDNAIRTDSLVTTEIYCAYSQYHCYYSLLRKAETYQRYDARLDLLCDNQSRRLVFRPVH